MKKDIHPEYNEVTVKCVCGEEHKIGSVMKDMKVEICSACHPFFTGNEKTLDSAGRVDKFKKRMEAAKK
jgi:large subunit ribosomal protein L31